MEKRTYKVSYIRIFMQSCFFIPKARLRFFPSEQTNFDFVKFSLFSKKGKNYLHSELSLGLYLHICIMTSEIKLLDSTKIAQQEKF